MKKFFIAAVMLLMCYQAFGQLVVTQKKDEPIEKGRSASTFFLDYRPYTSTGFFVSANPYPGDYDPIGELELRVDPKTVKNTERKKLSEPIYLAEEIPLQELLNAAVVFAKEMGGDGLVNFKITTVEFTGGGEILIDNPIKYYLITGTCISRKRALRPEDASD